jgi:hypothetical protein
MPRRIVVQSRRAAEGGTFPGTVLEAGQSFLALSEPLPAIFHVVSGFARLDSD